MSKKIEKQILNTLKKDKNLAFDLIVETYSNMLFNMAYRFLDDFDLSKDLVQEIYIKIWKNLDKFKGNSSIFTWIYKIAYNTSINYAKKHQREKKQLNTLKNNYNVNTNSNEFSIELQQALNSISEKERMAIILKHINNMSYKEIAQIMNMSEKAIDSILYRAREHLRDILKRGKYETY